MPSNPTNVSFISLINAIANQEGYGQSGAIPTRSNNPGDLKNGDIGYGVDTNGETVYPDANAGYAALQNQIQIIANGTSPVYNAYAQSLGLDNSSQLTLAQVGAKYAEDPNWANSVGQRLGVDPNAATVSGITNGDVSTNVVTGAPLTTQNPPGGAVTITDGPIPQPVAPASGDNVSPDQVAAFRQSLYTKLQVNNGMNLGAVPWFDDPNLLTGNRHIRQTVQPVSFTVFLSQVTGEMLINPNTLKPIELQLNCSLTQFELQSKHVYNHTPSRTGQHLTFWGMQPDLISGSGSTGVFMNQFGITDFFSVAQPNDDIAQLIQQGFAHLFVLNNSAGPQASTGTVVTDNVANQNAWTAITGANSQTAFRVAAQDAFVEFMKLFQMNGNVWLHNPNNAGYNTGQEQSSPSGWSPQTGLHTLQHNARNNDVLSRGYIAMKHKNNVYLGYFKSLSWAMDAEKPFAWTFNFTFQVEKTYSALYFPTSFSAGQAPTTISILPNEII